MTLGKLQDFMTFVSLAVNVQNMRQTIGREVGPGPSLIEQWQRGAEKPSPQELVNDKIPISIYFL